MSLLSFSPSRCPFSLLLPSPPCCCLALPPPVAQLRSLVFLLTTPPFPVLFFFSCLSFFLFVSLSLFSCPFPLLVGSGCDFFLYYFVGLFPLFRVFLLAFFFVLVTINCCDGGSSLFSSFIPLFLLSCLPSVLCLRLFWIRWSPISSLVIASVLPSLMSFVLPFLLVLRLVSLLMVFRLLSVLLSVLHSSLGLVFVRLLRAVLSVIRFCLSSSLLSPSVFTLFSLPLCSLFSSSSFWFSFGFSVFWVSSVCLVFWFLWSVWVTVSSGSGLVLLLFSSLLGLSDIGCFRSVVV